MAFTINKKVIVSGADFFRVEELNPYSHLNLQPDKPKAISEHEHIISALKNAGIDVIKVPAPKDCQDGIYTANWALCWKGIAVLSNLPNKRRAEEPHAKSVIETLGYRTIKPPFRFSGQGDALAVGEYLFVGSNYRTDPRMHKFLANTYNCEVIGLTTIPELDNNNQPLINKVTGWPDSYFYDLDIALAPINSDTIAWCPDAFTKDSRLKIQGLALNKIEVSLKEAEQAFACNLISTGETVIMSAKAPQLKSILIKLGYKVVTPSITELAKGGGYIRCCGLTLA